MLEQERLIGRVKAICEADQRLDAALMYGSCAQGRGDEFSDIEFWLFFRAAINPVQWCQQIGPRTYAGFTESGGLTVFFPGLIRGEFHFGQIGDVHSWPARAGAVVVVDHTGALGKALESLPETPQIAPQWTDLCSRYVNWLTLAFHTFQRGEYLRALDALSHAQRCLLWMARLAEDRTQHWLTPSRRAEQELPVDALRALSASTSSSNPDSLAIAIRNAWATGRTYWTLLASQADEHPPADLFRELDATLIV